MGKSFDKLLEIAQKIKNNNFRSQIQILLSAVI